MQFDTISLSGLHSHPRWIAWQEIERAGTKTKVPQNPNRRGHLAQSDNPETWATYAKARKLADIITRKATGGVGFVLGDLGDGTQLCGIDLDSCYDHETAAAAPHAVDIIRNFPRAYAEISPSLTGIKLYVRITAAHAALLRNALGQDISGKPRHGRTWARGPKQEVAVFHSNKYFAYTGKGFGQDPDICAQVGPNDSMGMTGIGPFLLVINELGPDYKSGRPRDRDTSGSGRLFHLAQWLKSAGGSREDFEDAIDDFPEAAAHVAAHGARAIERAWQRSPEAGDAPEIDTLTEEDIIQAFTEQYASALKYDHTIGKWFNYTGCYWKQENTKLASDYARSVSVAMVSGGKPSTVRAIKSVRTWEAIERGARTVRDFAIENDVWDADPMVLGTPSGTIDLKTGRSILNRPDDFISKVTAVSPVDLESFAAESDCPQWLEFLNTALNGDHGAIRFLQQWGGYCLTGETKEQSLVFVYGPGGAGKGTAINTIGDILGDYCVTVGMETLTASKHERHTTELARLRGARLARASETEKGRRWAENRIKNLTGQDVITARFMRQDDFEFRPQFKLTIFGNNRPSLKDVDSAIRRRFIVLPFDHPPEVRDPDLSGRLRREWPGILAWLIQGCLDWQKNGLTYPAVVTQATNEYFEQEDVFGQWLEDCCDVGPRFVDTVESLWNSWSSYAYELGEDPGSKNKTFPETLMQRRFERVKDTRKIRGVGYAGLRVSPSKAKEPQL